MQVEKMRISTHKRTRNIGSVGTSERPYCPRSQEGLGMYVFKIQDGSRRYSITKHCSEADADTFVSSLS